MTNSPFDCGKEVSNTMAALHNIFGEDTSHIKKEVPHYIINRFEKDFSRFYVREAEQVKESLEVLEKEGYNRSSRLSYLHANLNALECRRHTPTRLTEQKKDDLDEALRLLRRLEAQISGDSDNHVFGTPYKRVERRLQACVAGFDRLLSDRARSISDYHYDRSHSSLFVGFFPDDQKSIDDLATKLLESYRTVDRTVQLPPSRHVYHDAYTVFLDSRYPSPSTVQLKRAPAFGYVVINFDVQEYNPDYLWRLLSSARDVDVPVVLVSSQSLDKLPLDKPGELRQIAERFGACVLSLRDVSLPPQEVASLIPSSLTDIVSA